MVCPPKCHGKIFRAAERGILESAGEALHAILVLHEECDIDAIALLEAVKKELAKGHAELKRADMLAVMQDRHHAAHAKPLDTEFQTLRRFLVVVRRHHRVTERRQVVAEPVRPVHAQERRGRRRMELHLHRAIILAQRLERRNEQLGQAVALAGRHRRLHLGDIGNQCAQRGGLGGLGTDGGIDVFVVAAQFALLGALDQPIHDEQGWRYRSNHSQRGNDNNAGDQSALQTHSLQHDSPESLQQLYGSIQITGRSRQFVLGGDRDRGYAAIEQTVNVDQRDHTVFMSGQRTEEGMLFIGGRGRHRLQRRGIQRQDIRHGIDQQADRLATNLDNNHDIRAGRLGHAATEANAQIEDRHHGAAQIDHTAHEGRRIGQWRHIGPGANFTHAEQIEAVILVANGEGQHFLAAAGNRARLVGGRGHGRGGNGGWH
jgi:hypothetical protein